METVLLYSKEKDIITSHRGEPRFFLKFRGGNPLNVPKDVADFLVNKNSNFYTSKGDKKKVNAVKKEQISEIVKELQEIEGINKKDAERISKIVKDTSGLHKQLSQGKTFNLDSEITDKLKEKYKVI